MNDSLMFAQRRNGDFGTKQKDEAKVKKKTKPK
jgi:hypothetical protein